LENSDATKIGKNCKPLKTNFKTEVSRKEYQSVEIKYFKLAEKLMAKETTKIVLQSMIALSSAALGLVAALAWNDAIKETIKLLLGGDDSLTSKYIYAIFATAIAVVVVLILARIAAKVGGEAIISREAEG
jgi:hypothetical protein